MPKKTIDTQPLDDTQDGGHFATMPKDISHVTFYFDLDPDGGGEGDDAQFFFVKIETPDSVNDDLDNWYQDALTEILLRNAQLEGAENVGVAIKFGSARGGSGGEFYYEIDNDSTDEDDGAPTGAPVQARDYGDYGGGVEYGYGDLFA
ncbi:hypothetical protein [uncultured Phenylobacterium sp.]|uniref:hypothetical protein n=1 Tax=uncultured Phenylobacterium sp. TaxID=349273 RepID=UPI0025FC9107|nr:hypothetical protein [uncultured Phenylobacterium sp.]